MRLCPPLKILASSPYCCRKAIASGMVFGLRYSKAGGIIVVHPPIEASGTGRNTKANPAGIREFAGPGNFIVLERYEGQTHLVGIPGLYRRRELALQCVSGGAPSPLVDRVPNGRRG